MLKSAFNAITFIHSRTAMLKRLGSTVDIYSPCRLTPSNYFRFLRGPEYTTIKGAEFIIPVDSLTEKFAQKLLFDRIPDAGTFKIKFGANTTPDLDFDITAGEIQTEIRNFAGYGNVTVTGSFNLGFTIVFVGFSSKPSLGEVIDSTLEESSDPVVAGWINQSSVWTDLIKKGDRIVDGSKTWTIDEIIEMHDLKAEVMAYRIRCD